MLLFVGFSEYEMYLKGIKLFIRAMGFPTEFFPVLFAIPRMAGYLAHWRESLDDPDTKIMRPQQVSFSYLINFEILLLFFDSVGAMIFILFICLSYLYD